MLVFFFQAEDGIRDGTVTGVQTCALPISVAAVESLKRRGLALQADVTSRADAERSVSQTVQEFGRLDILVNNAGVIERSTLEDLDEATFAREVDVIAKGTYLFTQAVYPVMKRQR